KGDQVEAVSTTVKPVTQTAEVAVKRASRMETGRPSWAAAGRLRRTVPARMAPTKPNTRVRAGLKDAGEWISALPGAVESSAISPSLGCRPGPASGWLGSRQS